ncbi:MAG: ester cyclase [Paracoccaceae bacterium]|nr:ester cyclase [Paracoccaceae bacterium]
MKDRLERLAHCVGIGETAPAAADLIGASAPVRLAHPLGGGTGPGAWVGAVEELARAFPDLERRDTIRIEGKDAGGATWLGAGGYFCGTFQKAWRGIPPTRRMASLRYHEFFRIEGGVATEVQSLWDVPELMLQAGVWPMGPNLGREWHVPGPATQDGLRVRGSGRAALKLVSDMLTALGRNREGVAAMELDRYWHPALSWYGPSGIGTARGIAGFRAHHQAPFLASMPNRRALMDKGHLFAQGNYVGFTAWPGMAATLSGGDWLGIAGAGQEITLRSLDFWRVEAGLIRENWVLVDLLDVYDQLGVDVMKRARALR